MSPYYTKKLAGALLGLTSLMTGAVAQATVLTFNNSSGDSAFFSFNHDYGDRVTALEDVVNDFGYGLGAGFTPNITIEYTNAGFVIYDSGYGDLINVMGHQGEGLGEVMLMPDPGYSVVLHGFDVAPWARDLADSQVRVLDADDNVLFDSGLFDAIHADGHYHFPDTPIVSFAGLRIINTAPNDIVGTVGFGYLGLDNVSFSQTVVPVPAALPLFLSALAGVGLMRRTRR